jgi:hypothetical protein
MLPVRWSAARRCSRLAGAPASWSSPTPLPRCLPGVAQVFGTSRFAAGLRLAGLGLVVWSVVAVSPASGADGRVVLVAVLLAVAVASRLVWAAGVSRARPGDRRRGVPPYLYPMAAAGGLLCGARPDGAASAFVFVGAVAAALRAGMARAGCRRDRVFRRGRGRRRLRPRWARALANALGFAGAALVGSNPRQSSLRAEQAEVLLAQTQRNCRRDRGPGGRSPGARNLTRRARRRRRRPTARRSPRRCDAARRPGGADQRSQACRRSRCDRGDRRRARGAGRDRREGTELGPLLRGVGYLEGARSHGPHRRRDRRCGRRLRAARHA